MMKFIFPIFIVILPFFDSCVNSPGSKNEEAQNPTDVSSKKGVRNTGARLSSEELLTDQESLRQPELIQTNGKLRALSQLQFNQKSDGRLMLKDLYWNDTWKDGLNSTKTVYWAPEHFSEVRNNELAEVDVEDMRGFEFAPMVIKMKNSVPWEGEEFAQHFIQIPLRAGQNRNHWKEGNLEYFFLPDDFKGIGNTHLPQFFKDFPDYTLPSNKMGITSMIFADDLDNAVASKGYTYTASFQKPELPRVEYDYDQWLYESGAPPVYSTGQEAISDWLARVDENTLMANFRKYLMDRHAGASHLVLDWVAVREPAGQGLYKLEKCLALNKKERPYQTISLWPKGIMELSRIKIEGNNYKRELTRDLTFEGTFEQWHSRFGQDSPLWKNSFAERNADIVYVGGYMNAPTNYGFVHHFLIQHLMNKKFAPDKKSLLMWWARIEYVGGFQLGNIWFENEAGDLVYAIDKPMVFPSSMHNAAVWSFAVCDGGELWNEPYGLSDNKKYLGGKLVRNRDGHDIQSTPGPNQNEIYAIQNYRNVDRWEGGKWAVSQNKDIIEAQTQWDFVSAARPGEAFTTGTEVLPVASLYDHKPLAAVKMSQDLHTALVLVYDAWNNPLRQNEIAVKVGNTTQKIKVFGRYTSVVRVSL